MSTSRPAVLHVVADGTPGGGTTHVIQLLAGMQQNYRVGVVTQAGSYLLEQTRGLNIKQYSGTFFGPKSTFSAARDVRAAIEDFHPDVIHAHGGRANYFLQRAGSFAPIVYTVHGFHHRKKWWLRKLIGSLAERAGIAGASHVVFVSEFDARAARNERLIQDGKPYSIVYYGVKVPPAPPRESRPWSGKIGFVGRLVPQKHPELFVRMLSLLPQARATMIGGGELAPVVKQVAEDLHVADRIDFRGEVPRDAVLTALMEFDCLVMTSRWEGLPILAIESHWLGVPLVSTAADGMVEIIDHEQTGLLVYDESPRSLADQVERLAEDPALCDRMRRQGPLRAQQLFSEEAMFGKLFGIYDQLAADPDVPSPGAAIS